MSATADRRSSGRHSPPAQDHFIVLSFKFLRPVGIVLKTFSPYRAVNTLHLNTVREIITVFFLKSVTVLCGQKVDFVNVKLGDT